MNDIQQHLPDADSRPLPLIVAEKWGFKLDYAYRDGKYLYAIQDWVAGLTSSKNTVASRLVRDMRRHGKLDSVVTIHALPYTANDGKKYVVDFTDDEGLYIIAQQLKVMKGRPLLAAIQKYLADAGVLVDKVRRKPETVVEAGMVDPDKALDAVIKMYKRQGKSDEWIRMRINTKIQRIAFTSALKAAMADIARTHYSKATNEIYVGLWERTASKLREEMGLNTNANLRDYQPMAALFYQGLAEDGCAREPGDCQELTWGQASIIIRDVAQFIGRQAREYGERFGVDLATGKPLLKSGRQKRLPAMTFQEDGLDEDDSFEEDDIWQDLLEADASENALPPSPDDEF